jgi:hypothetical protein
MVGNPWRYFTVVLAATSLIAAACAGEPERPLEEAGDLSGETVEVAAVWTGEEQASFEAVLNEFAQQTGATVNFTSTGEDIATVLGTRIEGGNPPDIALLPQPGLLRDLVGQDALIPIDDIAGDAVDENYASIWREFGSVDDTLYGVWFKAANKSTFWYNVNVFNDAGVTPPEDWDGLRSAADTVSAFGVPPISIAGADGWTLSDWFENVYIRTAGPDMYDQLAAHEIPWTDQSVKDALAVMAEIFGEEDYILGGASGALQTAFPDSVADVFANPASPDAGMVYEADFVATVIANETDSVVGEDADFFNFPSIEGSPLAVVGAGDVAVLMKDTPGGTALMEYLATPEAAEIRAEGGGFTSANLNVDLSVYPDEQTRRSAEALTEAGDNVRFDLSDLQPAEFGSTTGQGIWGELQNFLRNPDDIDQITENLEEQATQAYGG